MDALAMLGGLAATEGTNAMAILAPPQLPPGNVHWTARDISAADQTFATSDHFPLGTLMMTSMCVVAWKDATFVSSVCEEEKEQEEEGQRDKETE
jgi:hypothetical protein